MGQRNTALRKLCEKLEEEGNKSGISFDAYAKSINKKISLEQLYQFCASEQVRHMDKAEELARGWAKAVKSGELPKTGKGQPLHYYYFPFDPDAPLDKDATTTKSTMHAKYIEGNPTVDFTRPKGSKVTDPYPVLKPKKIYRQQKQCEITCTFFRTKKLLEERDQFGHFIEERGWGGKQLRPLRIMKAGDILLVDGHCNTSSDSYCNRRDFWAADTVKLRPEEIAVILIKEGLVDGAIIKLLGCHGAGTMSSNANGGENNIFAKKLAMKLKDNCPNCAVAGYPGQVGISNVSHGDKVFPNPIMADGERGSDVIRYYNTDGELLKGRPGKDT